MKKKTAIIFDLDDTLLPSTQMYELCLKSVGTSLNDKHYQKAREMTKSRLGTNPSAHHRLIYFKTMAENRKKFSSAQVLKTYIKYESNLEKMCAKFAKKLGRKKLLKKLSSKFDLFILTNETLRTQLVKIKSLDPKGKFFTGILTSEEAGCEKPSKEMFHELLKRHRLKASECYFVGDSVENDMVPAHALGMTPIYTTEFTEVSKSRSPRGMAVISSLEELLEWV